MKSFKNIIELQKHFNTEQKCREYLEEIRWAGKPYCPHCLTADACRFPNGRTFKCRNRWCRKKFSVTVGTIYEHSTLPLTKWFLAIYLITNHKKGISSLQLASDLGITQKTAWFVNHRIREMMMDKDQPKMRMVIEADETFVGGKNKNRHADKKIKDSQGRSGKDKTAVFGLKQRAGRVVAQPVPNTGSAALQNLINNLVQKGAVVVTDEWKGYNAVSNNGYNHAVINHNSGEYVRGYIHSNGIENFWSMLKRGIIGIYHNVSPKHLHRYCNEFTYRYNERDMFQDERFNETLKRCNTRLKYDDLTFEFAKIADPVPAPAAIPYVSVMTTFTAKKKSPPPTGYLFPEAA